MEEAVRLGLGALALTDHNGFYGAVRFAEAARAHGLPTVFGAELTLDMAEPPEGQADSATTCWCWPATPQRPPGPGHHHRPARRAQAHPASAWPSSPGWPSRPGAHGGPGDWWC
ncbi:MAG: PHP domain-containing protein [Acidimicrobiales bacterium]